MPCPTPSISKCLSLFLRQAVDEERQAAKKVRRQAESEREQAEWDRKQAEEEIAVAKREREFAAAEREVASKGGLVLGLMAMVPILIRDARQRSALSGWFGLPD